MKRTIGLILLALTGCANLPTPPRIPQDPALLQAGLQLMQMGQPQVQSAPVPIQTNCIVYPPNRITGQSQVVCH